MAGLLLIVTLVVIATSVAVAGRFRYPLEPRSSLDRFFVGMQLVGNGLALLAAVLLPTVTGFHGFWGLAYLAAALLVAAFALYPVQHSARGPARPDTSGRHSVAAGDLNRTRWPYQTAFASAYLSLLFYVMSIFGLYF